MSNLEIELYWEMVRTIKLLGGKSDILGALGMMDSSMSQGEAVQETFRLVKCWNDKVENQIDKIPQNALYEKESEYPCGE